MKKKNKLKPVSIQRSQEKDEGISYISHKSKIFLFGLPSFGVIMLFFIWFDFYKPKIVDDWIRGVVLVDSASKTDDPVSKKNLLDSGGNILRQQINLHPYHARVWFLYGYYFLVKNNWDSCIYADKKAIELGAGGVVNSVEYMASEHLNYALERKLNEIPDLETSLRLINNATTNNFQNNSLDKFKGRVFYIHGQIDSSNFYLERFIKNAPTDFEVLSMLAYNYSKTVMKDKALYYANEAQKIKNDDPVINNLINQLNAQ